MAELNPETVIQLLNQQKSIINRGKTGSLEFRLQQLQALKRSVQQHEREIIQALHQDLRKSEFEAYSTEIGYLYDSIGYVMKNLHKWMKPRITSYNVCYTKLLRLNNLTLMLLDRPLQCLQLLQPELQ